MDANANNAADAVISSVKKSNLNFFIQESPFSLVINLRKSFVKNRDGHFLYPSRSDTTDTTEQKLKIEKLEKEKLNLSVELEKVKAENFAANRKVEKLKQENEALEKKNNELQANIDTLENVNNTAKEIIKSKDKELTSLAVMNNDLEESLKNLENENINVKEKLMLKDDEVKMTLNEKVNLEEKMQSLLDILYGCHECGLLECECGESVTRDCERASEPPSQLVTPAETPAPKQPPCSDSPLWSPPPTPPCDSCGGPNFGPCPGNVCFGCIPPLDIRSELDTPTNSPSKTPPGSPPLLRIKQPSSTT